MQFFNKEINKEEVPKKTKLSQIIEIIQDNDEKGENTFFEDILELLHDAMVEAKMTEEQISSLYKQHNIPLSPPK